MIIIELDTELNAIIANPAPLMSALLYSSYSANRYYGCTHEGVVKIGIGNDEFKKRYEDNQG